LGKERFPSKRKSKLLPRSDGPFKLLEKINPNAYKIELPEDYGASATFNVDDLRPYLEEEDKLPSLRKNSFQAEEDDGDQVPNKSIAAEVPSKELDVMMAAHEQLTTSRIRPIFVTLVYYPPGGLGPLLSPIFKYFKSAF